jgi:hypothetical protein
LKAPAAPAVVSAGAAAASVAAPPFAAGVNVSADEPLPEQAAMHSAISAASPPLTSFSNFIILSLDF